MEHMDCADLPNLRRHLLRIPRVPARALVDRHFFHFLPHGSRCANPLLRVEILQENQVYQAT